MKAAGQTTERACSLLWLYVHVCTCVRSCAFVVLKEGSTWGAGDATESNIIAFCRDQIAHFKAPKHVVPMDELPKTSTGP
jgi:acyl-coenzyme A synthetase/AMP-(fatty) acid ligase